MVLDAERDFEALRAPVWQRFRGRHAALGRERFEDAYAEWWSREIERAAAGRPSRAVAPVPFVAEAVHRVVLDDGRARARGLARDEKAALRIDDLDSLIEAGGTDDTEAQARHEALAHRVLRLVRDRLSPRELQVFVCTFLYLQTTEATARMLGLSAPRVKKDRARAAARVGDEVWTVLSAELDVCGPRRAAGLADVFEVLADHVEDCTRCTRSFGGLRSGALAVIGPIELLALAPGDQTATLWDAVYGRLVGWQHRWGGAATGPPAGGRGTAAAAAAVLAVAGAGAAASGAATEPPSRGPAPVAAPAVRALVTPAPAVPSVTSPPARRDREPRRKERRRKPEPRPQATSTPAPSPAPSPAQQVPAPPAPAPPASTGEFVFERR